MSVDRGFTVGDILFLERSIPGIPYDSGYWVLCFLNDAMAEVALVSQDKKGLYAIGNRYRISAEDLAAFSGTGENARITK